MKTMKLALAILLAAPLARAQGQLQRLPEPFLQQDIDKIMDMMKDKISDKVKKELEQERAQSGTPHNLDWLRELVMVLMIGGGVLGANRALNARLRRRRVDRNSSRVVSAVPAPGLAAVQPPILSETLCPDGYSESPLPAENQGGALLRAKQLLLSNELGLNELIHLLGPCTRTFKPCLFVTSLGIFSGFFFVAVGMIVISYLLWDFLSLALVVVVGSIMLTVSLAGGFVFIWAIRRISFRVMVCPAGIIQVHRGRAAGAFWDQISAVDLPSREDLATPLQFGNECVVHREDGYKFVFRGDYPKGLPELMETVVSHLANQG